MEQKKFEPITQKMSFQWVLLIDIMLVALEFLPEVKYIACRKNLIILDVWFSSGFLESLPIIVKMGHQ
jgi:hypothetical protein